MNFTETVMKISLNRAFDIIELEANELDPIYLERAFFSGKCI